MRYKRIKASIRRDSSPQPLVHKASALPPCNSKIKKGYSVFLVESGSDQSGLASSSILHPYFFCFSRIQRKISPDRKKFYGASKGIRQPPHFRNSFVLVYASPPQGMLINPHYGLTTVKLVLLLMLLQIQLTSYISLYFIFRGLIL